MLWPDRLQFPSSVGFLLYLFYYSPVYSKSWNVLNSISTVEIVGTAPLRHYTLAFNTMEAH